MKVTVNAKRLREAVSFAARVLPARPTMPALAGVLLVADEHGLTARAYDYDVAATAHVDADVATPGKVLLLGRTLTKVADLLPDRDAELVLEGSEALLRCGSAEWSLVTLPADDHPTLPEPPPLLGEVDGASLKAALGQVCPAADFDSAQPYLTAMQMELGERLLFTATDTARIAHREVSWQPVLDAPEITSMLLPARMLKEVSSSLGAGPVRIHGDERSAGLAFEGRTLVLRQIAGGYANWRRAYELLKAAVTCRVPLEEVAAAVQHVAVMADKTTPVRLKVGDGQILVHAGGEGGRGAEVVECEVDGGPLDLAYLPYVLTGGLAALSGETVTFTMESPGRGSLLVGEDSSFWYMAMPLKAGW